MSIALEKEAHRAIQMLRYCERVRTAARDFPGLGWVEFDRQARLRQACYPTRSWATMDGDLWLTELAKPTKESLETGTFSNSASKATVSTTKNASDVSNLTSFAQKDKTKGTREVKSKTCNFYNRGNCTRGTSCTFDHKCSQCASMRHAKIRCPSLQSKNS
jgi:hypothetical protein